jgi:hypothetical protein
MVFFTARRETGQTWMLLRRGVYSFPVMVADDGNAVTILPSFPVITVMQVAGWPLLSKPICSPVSSTRQRLQLLCMGDGAMS